MENTTQAHQNAAATRPIETALEPHLKPMLTVEQQIAHMKSKGIAFKLVSEEEAAAHLREKCQFFRIYAYRKLFPKRIGGPREGEYVKLDFGHLKALSNLDRQLRDVLLAMTLDIEYFSKVRLLAAAEIQGEDGYAIMRAYRESASENQRSYIDSELDRREHDPYVGAIIRKYRHDMPMWVFCESMPLGAFSSLVKFCAERWTDEELDDIHYLLKYVRSTRNATAHGGCWVNGITDIDPRMRPPATLVNALSSTEIPRRLRNKWLRGARMIQICVTLHLYGRIVPPGSCRSDRVRQLTCLFDIVHSSHLPAENPAVAALLFVERLTKATGLLL